MLSRITNDVDTLGMGLNQSITTIITSLTTMIGVLVMMLSISPLMTLIAVIILQYQSDLFLSLLRSHRDISKHSRSILDILTDRLRKLMADI